MSPTPMSQRTYHAKMETKGDVRVIDDGDVLVETIGAWQCWIGPPGSDVHSTKFFPPERLLVSRAKAEHLIKGNAAKIIEEPEKPKRRKRRKPKEDKAKKATEDKGAG